MLRWSMGLLLWLMLGAIARPARAQTDEIQVYDASIAPAGVVSLTWHDNFTPDGARTPDHPGGVIPNHALNGVTEWAYGVSDWMEAGLYFPLYSITDGDRVLFDGFKVRALFVKPDAVHSRFFYGVNFEFSYNTHHWNADRYTQEIRPIIGWHLGPVDVIFNPILDNSWKGFSNLTFAPAARLAWNASSHWAVAAEEYSDFGPLRGFLGHEQQSHQFFAVLDYTGSRLQVEAGVGCGLTPASDHRVIKLILMRDLNTPRR